MKQKSGKTGDKHINGRENVCNTLTIWASFHCQITEKAMMVSRSHGYCVSGSKTIPDELLRVTLIYVQQGCELNVPNKQRK
jgi:hypothetical protein